METVTISKLEYLELKGNSMYLNNILTVARMKDMTWDEIECMDEFPEIWEAPDYQNLLAEFGEEYRKSKSGIDKNIKLV